MALHNFVKLVPKLSHLLSYLSFLSPALLPPTGIRPFKILSAFTILFQPWKSFSLLFFLPFHLLSVFPPINNQFTVSAAGVRMFNVSSPLLFNVLSVPSSLHPCLHLDISVYSLEFPLFPPPASLLFPLNIHPSFHFRRRRSV